MTSQIKTIQSVSVDFDPFADQKPTLIKSVPSTAAQLEIWSSVLMDPKASSAFNESFTLKFKGELRVPALINALELTVARHDALRASFSEDGTSFRVFDYQEIQCGLENIEKQALEELIESEAREPLDLVNGPLFRVRLLKESDTCHYLIFTAHHIICDGWSLGIVIADLSAFYNSTVKGNSADLEEAYSFVDFAGQSSENEDKQYWLDKFSKRIPDYELILDKDRPKNRTFNARRIDVDVDLDLITEIKKSAASIGCSLSAYTMAIYFIALQRWTGESFLAVGMPTAAQPGIAPNSLIGHCVSTVPIVSELNPSISVAQAIHEISEEILDAFEHQNFTFGELIRELPIARDPSRIPLLPLLYNFDTGLEDEHLDFHELKCSFHSNPRFYENFEQFMNVADYGDHFTIECQYNTDLFLEESIKARIDEYIWLLTQCSFNLNQSLSELELSPINDYEYLLTRSLGTHHFWHEEQANAPRTVGHYLHHQAQQFAEKEAVIFEQEVLSYRQLDELSSQWAQLLLEEHVSVGDRVGLCLDRSQHMLAALIGILKVGASYVPLDPDFPDDRLAYMIEDSGLQHLVTQETHIKRLPSVAHILNTDLISERLSQQNTACPDVTIPEDTAAYIIYTSGSTGKPKGVVVPHASVMNFLHSMAEKPGLQADDTLMAVTTLSFDIAVLELYLPLWVGAKIIIAKKQDSSDGRRLLSLLIKHQANFMQATPATWRLLISSGWQGEPRLKALCGGEALPLDLAEELLQRCSELWNMYGPTETTVWSSCAQITQTQTPPGLGLPIANTQLYVLDEQLRPVPNGIAGELYIGGDGLTLGYNNRDELTRKVFIPNPFGDGQLYRTGDKVRYTHDGTLTYMGRLDQQVKVRGYRIELGEIETLMRQHDAIDDCALSVREVRAGDTRLIAYVVWKNSPISLSELREHLRQQLPPYMVPQHLEALGELPRTLNNKLDRKALESLPLSESSSLGKEEVRAATTATELKLLSIWQEVINKPISNINENFFDLGGHSLLIAQIIHRVEMDMSVQLKFSDLYEFADIESLAKKIDQSQHTEQSTITKRSENEPALLTLAQQRLWYLNQLEGSSTAYNLPSAFRLKGKLNKLALNQAFQNLISRQEALSAEVIEIDSQPHQRLRNISNFELSEVSFADIDKPIERELELKKRLTVLQNQVFDINHDILFKAELIILSEEESILFFMPHHIIFDGWSFDLFIHELSESYNAYCCGINAQLPVLDYQFADYANWSRLNSSQEDVEKDVSYWVEHLQGAPNLDMPLDRPRPETQDIRGEQVSFELPSDLLSRLNGLALEKDVTLFMVMMASYCALLAKYTDQEDLVIATPMADRTKPGTEDLIGFFVNALVLRFRLSREMPFLELLQQVKQQCLEGFDHMRAPFEKIVERLNPERDMSRAPIYQTSITYQDVSKREQVMGSGDHTINIKQCEIPSHDSPLDLNIWFKKRGDSLSGAIVYSTSLFTEKTIQGFRDHFLTILGQIAQNPITRLCDIELLNQSSSKQVMRQCIGPAHAWHEEQAKAPRTVGHYLHHQAQQFAESDAVIFEQEVLSYRQLDELSSQWAQLLLEEHVSVGDRVGLCLDRSQHMLAALIGILKVGASYVPLDPDFPDDRLAYMIEDSGLQHLVTQEAHIKRLPSVAHILNTDLISERLSQQNTACPDVTIPEDTAAYIIYTSGSTGKPKGVVVPHASVMNFLHSMAEKPGLEADDTLMAVTTLSFDIAVLELYLPLWVGAKVIIAKKQDSSDGRRLLSLLTKHQANFMQATPATWRLLISSGWQGEPRLKALCGGEALPLDLAEELLQRCSELWNMYGPTETTVWSSCAQITQTQTPPGLGLPIANTQLFVLDEQLRPVPNGIAGELYIGGDGLTLGYNNRDELTRKVFIPNPFGDGQLYRTGDKVRYTHDGTLMYMGRLDQQVKVRGYRIELGEIETLMRQHDAIDDCALSVREVRAGDTRLIAYVVWKNSPISLSELREHLRQQLPPYMVPQHLEALGELPRTLNNKLDRKVLQSWNLTQMSAGESRQGPETSTEKWLALCWGEVCGNHDINKYDNFFDIGGHSLLSIQVIHKVQAHFNVELKPRDLLLESLHQLAELIDQTTKTAATESSAAKGLSDETNKTELHSPATQTIHPVFFGDSKLPLYGVIHEPGAGAYRSKAILFSSPIGHEYFRNYRMTQLLATSLAKQGFYCMRFDYHGVGDSTGEFSTQSIEEWQQDLIKAYEELKARAGVEQVVCVASRLGASIATLANTKCQFNELVLWDPILNGSDYLGKLDTLQKQVLTQNWHFSVRRKSSDLKQGEYLGYQYCTKLQKQIDSLRLADQLNSLNDTPCTVISTTEDESLSATGGQHINYQHIDDEGNWYFYKDIDRSISTHNINQFILKSLSQ